MDIWQIQVKSGYNYSKKSPSHLKCTILSKMALLFSFKFKIFPLSVDNLYSVYKLLVNIFNL